MLAGRASSGRLLRGTLALEATETLDRLAPMMSALASPFNRRPLADVLRGHWLGHALHPLLTDVPLGCWIGALTLDAMPEREAGSRALVAAGLAAVPVTLAAGLAEWGTLKSDEQRRVATVHALGNVLVAMAFARSWLHRHRGHRGAGVIWSLIGGGLALVTGYLGGHLSFAQRAGTGRR